MLFLQHHHITSALVLCQVQYHCKNILQIKALYQSIDSIEVIGKVKCFLINDLLNSSQSIHSIDVTRKPKQHNDLRSTPTRFTATHLPSVTTSY
jgi:hypothetical protein